MNKLNLLPREPIISRLFVPFVLLIVGVWITMAISFTYLTVQLDSKTAEFNRISAEAQQQLLQLQHERGPDPLTASVEPYRETVDQLKKLRIDWVPVLESIQSGLTQNSRLTSLQANDTNAISAHYTFSDMESVASYVSRLQRNSIFESIDIRGITRMENRTTATSSLQVVLGISLKAEGQK